MPRRAGLVLLIVLAAASPARALDPARALNQYSRQAWRSSEGLPQNTVSAILQTRDGYLWLATYEGVARFDGVRFTVFDRSNTDAMTQNHVSALLEARDGTLWVGTYGGGLLRYKDRRFEAYAAPDGAADDQVTALAEDGEGSIWVGTTGGVFLLRDGRTARYTSREGLPDEQVLSLAASKDGGVWVGTTAGVARLGRGAIAQHEPERGLPSTAITSVLEEADGALWLGTAEGLFRLQRGSVERYGRAQGLADTFVRSLYRDREGTVWVGTSGGLHRWHDGRFDVMTAREGLSRGAVVSLYEDREGSLWVGTDGGGLNRLRDGKVFTLTSADGLSTDAVYTIAGERAGGLWIGGASPDLVHFAGGALSPYPSAGLLAGSTVLALFEDSRGRLWIGTDRGLYVSEHHRMRPFGERQELAESGVRAIAEDRQGAIWIGTESSGLRRYADGRLTVFGAPQGLRSSEIRAIHVDRKGTLWVATYGGLSRLEGPRFVTYTPALAPSSAFMRSIHEDATRDTLWVGTYGGGLHRFRDNRFATITSRQGLASDVVYQVLEDDRGRLWMSSNKGIFHVPKAELEAVADGRSATVHSTLYGEKDGMRSRECNGGSPAGWKTSDGRLWFPTFEGVVVVDPSRIVSNDQPPPIVLEEAIVDDRSLDLGSPIRIAPGNHRLEFRYTGLSLAAPQAVRFSYRLVGADAKWVDAGSRRSAFFTNLPPGRYKLEVNAANEDGVWNPTPASLDFRLAPHFYQTPWFFGGCALAAGLMGLGAHRWRTRALRLRERQLAERVEEALARVKTLSGLLPICAACKKIRDDQGYWSQIETYVSEHSAAEFTHSLCPECVRRLYPEQSESVLGKG